MLLLVFLNSHMSFFSCPLIFILRVRCKRVLSTQQTFIKPVLGAEDDIISPSRSVQSISEVTRMKGCHSLGQIMNSDRGEGHHLSLGGQGGDACAGCGGHCEHRGRQKQS